MTSALRVLTVSDVSPWVVRGGGERVLWEEASRLARAGHQVRVVSRAPADGAPEAAERQGVRIRHFLVDERSLLRFVGSSILGARRTVGRELAEAGADVLYLHQPYSGYGALGSLAGRRLPSLYSFHSAAPLEYRSRRGMSQLHRVGWSGRLGEALLRFLERSCLRRAARIRVLSDFSARQLQALYGIPSERIVKIPGGVDAERFQPAPDRGAAREALGLPARSRLLLTVRNLEARMGLDALLRAMALLRGRAPDVLLLVAGAGSLRGALESLAASLGIERQVRFLGFVPEAELPRYYQAADLFVLPTRELEGFGLVAVEAMACGTPVLGTPVAAIPEILRELEPDLLLRGTDPEAIAGGIRDFLERIHADPESDRALRRRCRAYVVTRFGWDQVVKQVEQELLALAGCAGTGGHRRPESR